MLSCYIISNQSMFTKNVKCHNVVIPTYEVVNVFEMILMILKSFLPSECTREQRVPSSKHLIRWLRIAAWFNFRSVGSTICAIAVVKTPVCYSPSVSDT